MIKGSFTLNFIMSQNNQDVGYPAMFNLLNDGPIVLNISQYANQNPYLKIGNDYHYGNIAGRKMFTFVFSKGKEPVVYCNTTRISTSTNTVSKNIDYTTNFKLVIGRIPFLNWGYYKYGASKFSDVIVYNRRLNYSEIQELYNSLPVEPEQPVEPTE